MASPNASEVKSIITGLLTSNPLRSTVAQLCCDFVEIVGYKIPFQSLGFNSVEDYLRSIPDTVQVFGSGPLAEVQGVIKQKSAHIKLMVSKQKTKKTPVKNRKYLENYWKQSQKYCHPVHNGFQSFQVNVHNNSQHYTASPLRQETSSRDNMCKVETYSEIDSVSPKSQNDKKPETNKIDCVKIVASYDEDVSEKSSLMDECVYRVPEEVQNNLRKLILQFPNGIWCTKLPTEYGKMFKKDLCYKKYNYRSLIEMCTDLSNIFHYVQLSSDDYMLYDKSRPVAEFDKKQMTTYQPVQEENVITTNLLLELPKLDWSVSQLLIPKDVLCLSDEIPRHFPANAAVGDLLDINIGEIYDISKFWMYMAFGPLESLMKDLQNFFKINRDRYNIPELLIEEGLYCTAFYLNQYHRAVIVNVLPNLPNAVRVLFIDYGTVENVGVNEIWFLPKQFSEVPCQAIRARLSNICPTHENRPWSVQCINRFEELVSKATMVAEFTRIDEKDHILEIYLADIRDEQHIFYINDVLVEEGYAIYVDQERKPTFSDLDCMPKVKYLHLYPEFYEIESGMAPTPEERKYIAVHSIPLHHFMPQYFDVYYSESVNAIQEQHETFYSGKTVESCIPPFHKKVEFDFSLFPDSILDDIKDIVQENGEKTCSEETRANSQNVSKIERSNDENGEDKSLRQYFCNKKRISDLIHGKSSHNDSSKSKPLCESYTSANFVSSGDQLNACDYSQDASFSSLNKSFNELNLSNSDSAVFNNTKSCNSTNPFLDEWSETNPFRKTNPFLKDIETTATKNDILDIFAKPAEDKITENIVNNLNTTRSCCYKNNKQVNIDKANLLNNSNNFGNVTLSSSDSFRSTDKNEADQTVEVNRRIRTPPGFSSLNVPNRMAWNPNLLNLYNYIPNCFTNNPYYQGFQFSQLNNAFYTVQPQNQFSSVPFVQPIPSNCVPQLRPDQFRYNAMYLQQPLNLPSYNNQIYGPNNYLSNPFSPGNKKV